MGAEPPMRAPQQSPEECQLLDQHRQATGRCLKEFLTPVFQTLTHHTPILAIKRSSYYIILRKLSYNVLANKAELPLCIPIYMAIKQTTNSNN